MRWPHRINRLLRRSLGIEIVRRSRSIDEPDRASVRIRPGEAYAALATLRDRSHEYPQSGDRTAGSEVVDLRFAELKVFSQNGEDGIIFELVHRLPDVEPFFVEFGVQDGLECNTRVLLEVLGWKGVYFQPPGEDGDRLQRRWAGREQLSIVRRAIDDANVNDLFRHAGVPPEFGVLSIDVDGQDFWIWNALSDRFSPAIVAIECTANWPPGVHRVERRGLPWSPDFSDTLGASIDALDSLGRHKGYTLVHIELAGVNAFFVRDDLLDGLDIRGVTHRPPSHGLAGVTHPPHPVRPTVTPPTHRPG